MTNSAEDPAGRLSEFRQRIRYRFDRLLAHGTWVTLLWLGIVTLVVVALSALALALFDVSFTSNDDVTFFEDFWQSLLRVLDPGTMAGDVGWGRRFLALGVTLFGILVAGTLIGIIAAGVEERIDRMRGGRSTVFESGHVIVLGASDRLPTLIQQLVLANVGRPGNAIVVMADRDAVEMRDHVRRIVTDEGDSRLVFRSGDPTQPHDLEIVRLSEARTVIVLSDGDPGDSSAIRSVIAVDSALEGFEDLSIVVELSELASAQQLVGVYPTGVHPIVLSQGMGRIVAVALREPGVGQVAVGLLDDRGSDVHITNVPSLENRPFSEIHAAFPNARPIGFMAPDGSAQLNPPPEALLESGSRLVLVSGSEQVSTNANLASVADEGERKEAVAVSLGQSEQHLLVLGWSPLGATLMTEWVGVASPGSTAEVLLDPDVFVGPDVVDETLRGPNLSVNMTAGFDDVTRRLEGSPLIDTVLLLGSVELEQDVADSRTLLSLVALRRFFGSVDRPAPRVMVEILNVDNGPLVELGSRDDFVISDAIGSQLIAQLAEMPERRNVFLQLYDPVGPSLHLVPADVLGLVGSNRAAELYRTAYLAGFVAIGYRSLRSGLVLNPPQSQTIELDEGDQLVVIG